MYGEYVDIYVDGQTIKVFVLCFPGMPEYKLKRLAIESYLREMKIGLLKENGLEDY